MDSVVSSAYFGGDCIGRIIDGRFTLLRWLGGTEQSSVFLTDLEGDPARKAAIKLSRVNAVDAETRIAQWTVTRPLSHPHLMGIFHSGRCEIDGEDLLYVVTEYAEEVLSEILRERPLTPGETREMLGPILEVLSWLHSRHFLHGHLKPSNIMVVNDRLKLSADRLHDAGEPGRVSPGSGQYDAPEVALGKMSPAVDLWSLGVVLVEALTQRPPLWDGSGGGEPVVPASIPPPLFNIVRECLRHDPARRYTLSGIRDSLVTSNLRDSLVTSSVRDSLVPTPAAERADSITPTTPPPGTLLSRAPVMIAGAVLVVGVIVTSLVIGFHHRPMPPAVPQSSASAAHLQSPAPGVEPHKRSVVKGVAAYPAIPDVAQNIRDTIHGHVRVRIGIQVDSGGSVSDATIDSPGPSRYFANRALQTAREWKFRPAEIDGQAVGSKWILEFRFGRDGTTITPTETSP
ncbi:MAG TPA: TonB family protein [Acidobacteriaceae bacterium]|nr:TonB family protein [Acidobacteriaceae bacterium]